jgi:hypothetical protein
MPAKGKSPACELNLIGISEAPERGMEGAQKTRPSTQYTVNDLASPGY